MLSAARGSLFLVILRRVSLDSAAKSLTKPLSNVIELSPFIDLISLGPRLVFPSGEHAHWHSLNAAYNYITVNITQYFHLKTLNKRRKRFGLIFGKINVF